MLRVDNVGDFSSPKMHKYRPLPKYLTHALDPSGPELWPFGPVVRILVD